MNDGPCPRLDCSLVERLLPGVAAEPIALEERVRALTVEEIRDAMRRHLDLERMAFMKRGDFAGAAEN
jgi:hypothetical protein